MNCIWCGCHVGAKEQGNTLVGRRQGLHNYPERIHHELTGGKLKDGFSLKRKGIFPSSLALDFRLKPCLEVHVGREGQRSYRQAALQNWAPSLPRFYENETEPTGPRGQSYNKWVKIMQLIILCVFPSCVQVSEPGRGKALENKVKGNGLDPGQSTMHGWHLDISGET